MGEKRAASDSEKEEKTQEKNVETKESKSESKKPIVDMEIFQQILELDEDDSDEFSKGMVFAFFEQAEDTMNSMDDVLKKKDLTKLASLGHFLKGSSAALGLSQVQSSCEKIQHYGERKDVENDETLSEEDALGRISDLLKITRTQYDAAKAWLQARYETREEEEDDGDET